MVKKIVLIVLGLILFIVGLGIAAVGGVALGFGGRSGIVQSGYHTISTPTSGFVSDPSKVRDSNRVETGGSSVSVRVDGRNSTKPLFIGVGPTSQVDAYLKGVTYDEVTDVNFGRFRLETNRINGSGQPGAPGDQSFWIAQASGTNPQMNWNVSGDEGNFRVVIMNADASPGVALDARVGLKIKNLFGIGLGAAIAGGLLALLGLGLLIWGIAAKRRREDQLVFPGPYPPGGTPSGKYAPPYPPRPEYGQPYPPQPYQPQPSGEPPTMPQPPPAQPPPAQPPPPPGPPPPPATGNWQPRPPDDNP
jgi:hypothetical protein